MSLEEAIHKAKQADRDYAKEAGKVIGQELEAYNSEVKRKRDKHFDDEIHEITRYHADRVMKNRTYHFLRR